MEEEKAFGLELRTLNQPTRLSGPTVAKGWTDLMGFLTGMTVSPATGMVSKTAWIYGIAETINGTIGDVTILWDLSAKVKNCELFRSDVIRKSNNAKYAF